MVSSLQERPDLSPTQQFDRDVPRLGKGQFQQDAPGSIPPGQFQNGHPLGQGQGSAGRICSGTQWHQAGPSSPLRLLGVQAGDAFTEPGEGPARAVALSPISQELFHLLPGPMLLESTQQQYRDLTDVVHGVPVAGVVDQDDPQPAPLCLAFPGGGLNCVVPVEPSVV